MVVGPLFPGLLLAKSLEHKPALRHRDLASSSCLEDQRGSASSPHIYSITRRPLARLDLDGEFTGGSAAMELSGGVFR